jgi:hypothetical protein
MFLWAKACNTIVYIQNWCPHKILENNTLEEAFTGVKPEVSYFHIFGCPVCYRTVCSLGQRLKDRDQTGVTGTFPAQCHLNGEVLSV